MWFAEVHSEVSYKKVGGFKTYIEAERWAREEVSRINPDYVPDYWIGRNT
jgi:hypothetical protein